MCARHHLDVEGRTADIQDGEDTGGQLSLTALGRVLLLVVEHAVEEAADPDKVSERWERMEMMMTDPPITLPLKEKLLILF